MQSVKRVLFALGLLSMAACAPLGAQAPTPTAPPVATSYVAPLRTPVPTGQAVAIPSTQPEEITPSPVSITVVPAASATANP